MEAANLVPGYLSLLLHSLEYGRALKNAYRSAVDDNDVRYSNLNLMLLCYGSLVTQIGQIKLDPGSGVSLSLNPGELEQANRQVDSAIEDLKKQESWVREVEKELRETQSSPTQRGVLANILRGGKGMMNYLVGQEGDLEKIQRLLRDNFTVLATVGVFLNHGQISLLNHAILELVNEINASGTKLTNDEKLLEPDDLPLPKINKILEEMDKKQKSLAHVVDILEEIQKDLKSRHANVAQRTAILCPNEVIMGLKWTRERAKREHRNMEVDISKFKFPGDSASITAFRSPAVYTCGEYNVQGFVEWRPWDDTEPTAGTKTDVGYQVSAMAQVLAKNQDFPRSAKAPQCHAFFLDMDTKRYGMFFTFKEYYKEQRPPKDLLMPAKPHSLEQLLSNKAKEPDKHWKVATITGLMEALYLLHSVEVYHKAFSSKNILFLSDQTLQAEGTENPVGAGPYLAGLFQSRIAAMYSDFTKEGDMELFYLPWKYIEERSLNDRKPRPSDLSFYHPKYDLFGLGLVCYEVAVWKPLRESISGAVNWKESNARVSLHQNWSPIEKKIIEECEQAMGDAFGEAVAWCIAEGAAGGRPEDQSGHWTELNKHVSKIRHNAG